jgi:solute carrier family 25 iron transporter 28/37
VRYFYEVYLYGEQTSDFSLGPAHAVYFGTYEIVKEFAGSNKADGKHHPVAAGTNWRSYQIPRKTDEVTAASGACATIASDALMNPFDGT